MSAASEGRGARAERRGRTAAFGVLVALAFGTLALAGCDAAPAPPEPRLVAAVTDLHVLEARTRLHSDVSPALRDAALARHGYTRATFDAALTASQADADAYTALLAAVQERLGTRTRTGS